MPCAAASAHHHPAPGSHVSSANRGPRARALEPRETVLERAVERVTVMVPGVELAAARDFVSRAVSIPQRRRGCW